MNIRLTIISSIVLLTAFFSGCGNSSRAGYGSAASYDEAGEDYEVVDVDTTIEDSMEMADGRGLMEEGRWKRADGRRKNPQKEND